MQDWIARHPQWANIIADSTVSADFVSKRFNFRWQMFKVNAPVEANADAMPDNLQDDVSNLGYTLFGEIAKTASEAWKQCYMGKTEITRKALSPLKGIFDKLIGLTLVEPRVDPIVDLLRTAFDSIPKRGPITGVILDMLQGLVTLLQNPQALVEHGQMILDGRVQSQDILATLVQASGTDTMADVADVSDMDDAGDTEPVFVDAPFTPVIESHGLW